MLGHNMIDLTTNYHRHDHCPFAAMLPRRQYCIGAVRIVQCIRNRLYQNRCDSNTLQPVGRRLLVSGDLCISSCLNWLWMTSPRPLPSSPNPPRRRGSSSHPRRNPIMTGRKEFTNSAVHSRAAILTYAILQLADRNQVV